jgi:DNA modification methylase
VFVDVVAVVRENEGDLGKINWTLKQFRLDELTDYYKNPRSLSEKEFKQLKTSLDKFGMIDKPIVNADSANTIIGGHQRKHVLEATGVKECECWIPDRELTEREVEELNIRLNKNTGSWDFDTLANEWELDDLLDWGFDKHELDLDLWADEPPEDVEPQIDKAEELREKWGVETGQLWQLGEHRLICGDCTYPETVSRLLDGKLADMILTDPPYALFGNSTGVSGITDDKMTAPFFREIFKRAKEFTKPFAHIYVCCDWHSAFALRQAGVDIGLSEKNLIVWDKGDGGVGAMYQQCYELIWFFTNSPKSSTLGGHIAGERTVNGIPNIWRVGRESSKREHGAQKPVELFSIPVLHGVDELEIVMDLFLGSGTTLIACERLGRKCRAVEISPAYVAVAIQRWVDVTGGEPVLLEG